MTRARAAAGIPDSGTSRVAATIRTAATLRNGLPPAAATDAP